ncbi:hypothetical protein Nepgr_023223 [Nepenthes gracilis]|uniref:Uncharacterized protein n=1 Tax=Nepenthes gracilis TaxID=150966 RepID=A0AAD3T3Y8_NEPGR|nr:hypothetical protein Nepgr_023223 [Nepenthes gracilis]
MAFSQVITNEAPKSDGKIIGTVSAQKDTGNAAPEKMSRKDRKAESSSLPHDVLSNSLSSEDGRSDKQRSRRGHHRRRDTDSSEDYGDQHRSHSRDRKKWSSQGESRGRKHSKHKRVRGDSPVRHSHHGRQRDPSETTGKKRRQKE